MFFSLSFLENIIMTIFVLINIAFITLMERKILGFSQLRLGPNKPSFQGILQPAADAVKLFLKEFTVNSFSHKIVFFIAPGMSLLIVLSLWNFNPQFSVNTNISLSLIVILMLLGLNSYPTIFSGWSSSSKYTLLGSIRSVAQSISYEISLAFFLMSFIFMIQTTSMSNLLLSQNYILAGLVLPVLLLLFLISSVAESNRTPFDFAEGESELVSGFNTEYGSGGFAVIFMAEYGSIYFLSSLITVLFLFFSTMSYFILVTLLIFLWVWFRSTYPRYRYDLLMNLAWKSILPISLILLMITFSL